MFTPWIDARIFRETCRLIVSIEEVEALTETGIGTNLSHR